MLNSEKLISLSILPNIYFFIIDRKFVPTVYYNNQVLTESKDLIRYIDKNFTKTPFSMVPPEEK